MEDGHQLSETICIHIDFVAKIFSKGLHKLHGEYLAQALSHVKFGKKFVRNSLGTFPVQVGVSPSKVVSGGR